MAVWHPTVFTKNRDRLLEADVAREFLAALLALRQVKRLLSDEHFTVDGTLVDAWASMKSFRPKDGSGAPPGPGRNGERVEEVFGWIKAQAGFDQVKLRGRTKAEAVFTFATAAYNLIRIPGLLAGVA